jgi:hypothetical protein
VGREQVLCCIQSSCQCAGDDVDPCIMVSSANQNSANISIGDNSIAVREVKHPLKGQRHPAETDLLDTM